MKGVAISLALAAAAVTGCGRDKPAPGPPADPPVTATAPQTDLDDPEACRPCHAPIVDEFLTSMHARAHHSKDPIYAGVRRIRLAKEGRAIAAACRGCHAPRALDAAQEDDAVGVSGVNCASCHAVAEVHAGKLGRSAMVWTKGDVLLGPHDIEPRTSPAHGTGPAPAHMKDGNSLCLACHDKLDTSGGVSICATGDEHDAYLASSGAKTCVSCHMPRIPGSPGAMSSKRQTHASHRFLGPHHRWTGRPEEVAAEREVVGPAATVEAAFDRGELVIELSHQGGHSFPSGFPGRMAMLTAVGFDAARQEVWRSPGLKGPQDPAKHVLRKVYVDADGQPTLAPWSKRLALDTRLAPGERRTIRWQLPESVVRAEVKLVMRLLPPSLAKKIGLPDGAAERTPRTRAMVTVEAER